MIWLNDDSTPDMNRKFHKETLKDLIKLRTCYNFTNRNDVNNEIDNKEWNMFSFNSHESFYS